MIELRRSQLEECGAIKGVGLEIGAYSRPTVTSEDVQMRYVDFFSTEQLRAQAIEHGYEDPTAVVPVDFVVRGEDYRPFINETFDFIIANHVMEHIIDPVSWLIMLGDLLKPGGHLLITLPDKKRCFDRFRPDSDLSRLMYNYLSEASLEEKALLPSLEAGMYYDFGYINLPMEVSTMLNVERLRAGMHAHQPGVHCHVFQGETFLSRIMKPLLFMKVIDFSLANYTASSPFGEFYTVLRKGWTPIELTNDEFYTVTEVPELAE